MRYDLWYQDYDEMRAKYNGLLVSVHSIFTDADKLSANCLIVGSGKYTPALGVEISSAGTKELLLFMSDKTGYQPNNVRAFYGTYGGIKMYVLRDGEYEIDQSCRTALFNARLSVFRSHPRPELGYQQTFGEEAKHFRADVGTTGDVELFHVIERLDARCSNVVTNDEYIKQNFDYVAYETHQKDVVDEYTQEQNEKKRNSNKKSVEKHNKSKEINND